MIKMTLKRTMWMSATDCVYGVRKMTMTMMMCSVCSLVHTVGVIALALIISCCSRARRRLSCRLHMVSSGTTVISVSECSTTKNFLC